MKTLIFSLVLGSISAFADDCSLSVPKQLPAKAGASLIKKGYKLSTSLDQITTLKLKIATRTAVESKAYSEDCKEWSRKYGQWNCYQTNTQEYDVHYSSASIESGGMELASTKLISSFRSKEHSITRVVKKLPKCENL